MNKLSYQQKATMQRAQASLTRLNENTAALRLRIGILCVFSITLTLFVMAVWPQSITNDIGTKYLLGLVCILSAVLCIIASYGTLMGNDFIPGSNDTDHLFHKILSQDLQTAYNQVLLDQCEVNQLTLSENERVTAVLKDISLLFNIQLVVLVSAVTLIVVMS